MYLQIPTTLRIDKSLRLQILLAAEDFFRLELKGANDNGLVMALVILLQICYIISIYIYLYIYIYIHIYIFFNVLVHHKRTELTELKDNLPPFTFYIQRFL